MLKHRKILIFLHSIMTLVLLGASLWFAYLFIGSNDERTFFVGALQFLVFVGLPLLIGVVPILALVYQNPFTKKVLWFYCVVLGFANFPVGTLLYVYTVYYLVRSRNTDAQQGN